MMGRVQWQWKYTSQTFCYGDHNWLLAPASDPLNPPLCLHRGYTSCGQLPASEGHRWLLKQGPFQRNVRLFKRATLTWGLLVSPAKPFLELFWILRLYLSWSSSPITGIRPPLWFETSFQLLLPPPLARLFLPILSPAHLLLCWCHLLKTPKLTHPSTEFTSFITYL